MKQRLLVVNGQRLIEAEEGGQWKTTKVEKAGTLKPGIYSIYLASNADKSKNYDGTIVHADKEQVYQQIGKNFIKHDRLDFDKVPVIGSSVEIKYTDGRAVVSASTARLSRGVSR